MPTHSLPLAAAFAVLMPLASASAQLGFAEVGPVNLDHGFPNWYTDTGGLRLDLCLEQGTFCVLDGPSQLLNPGLPFPDNFGGGFTSRSYYNLVEASVPTNGGGMAFFSGALEASFDTGVVADGNQVVTARFRLAIDNLVTGELYIVTTPFGTFSITAESAGPAGIEFIDDVGGMPGVFDAALATGFIGPFLMWDTDLPLVDVNGREYLGDPAVPHTITGSPFGTNVFRVAGPSVGGSGIDVVETDLFRVSGLISLDMGPPPDPDPDDDDDPQPDPGFVVELEPGLAGTVNTLSARGASEGGLVAFVFGLNPGPRTLPLATCPGGLALDLRDPRLIGFGTALGGEVTLNVSIPPGLAGASVHLQGLDIAGCAASDLVSLTL